MVSPQVSKRVNTVVLLVNLGTPSSHKPVAVRRYLSEFLSDRRVISLPPLPRHLLVKGIIVPFRTNRSARSYRKIWTDKGSPLLVYSEEVKNLLQQALGEDARVVLAMRYQQPSLKEALRKIGELNPEKIVLLPLFPQYASATTGSIIEYVFEHIKRWEVFPQISVINHFHNHPLFINAFAAKGSSYPHKDYDKVLFSFHGLPEKHIEKCCPHFAEQDTKCSSCEAAGTPSRPYCYKASCYETAHLIAKKLAISQEKYLVSFQSRLGKAQWLTPETVKTVVSLAHSGIKRLLVFCPSFVCDCLETSIEIEEEAAELFQQAGGEQLRVVESLNSSEQWVAALQNLVWESSKGFSVQ